MRRLIALAVVGVVLAVLIVAQLVLPGLAASRLRDQLARSGTVLSVQVSAFPAVKLLWHHADKVVIRMGRYQSGASDLGNRLSDAAGVGTIDASAQELDSGALTLRNATLRKRGSETLIRPISARYMHRKEVEHYEKETAQAFQQQGRRGLRGER